MRNGWRLALAGEAVAALAGPALAGGSAVVGQSAPGFTKSVLGGGSASLADFEGRVVVLFLFGYG